MTQRPLLTLSLAILILLPQSVGATARLLDFVEKTPALRLVYPATSVVSPGATYSSPGVNDGRSLPRGRTEV